MSDPVTWFDSYGSCVCGKPAAGELRGPGNASYGKYCKRCAEKRLKAAEKARAMEARITQMHAEQP